jgi:hypothetical protein
MPIYKTIWIEYESDATRRVNKPKRFSKYYNKDNNEN